jgi:hypothetical protein
MIVVRESVLTHSDVYICEHVAGTPSPNLRSFINYYNGYREDLGQSVCRLQVPSARVILVLGFGDYLRIKPVGSKSESKIYQSFIVGLDGNPLLAEHDGTRHCIEIALRPWAANRLFHGASTKLAKETVALEDI